MVRIADSPRKIQAALHLHQFGRVATWRTSFLPNHLGDRLLLPLKQEFLGHSAVKFIGKDLALANSEKIFSNKYSMILRAITSRRNPGGKSHAVYMELISCIIC
jgi:hypothetical protein